MKLFAYLICILSLASCAPSKDQSQVAIGTEETKTHNIESCLQLPRQKESSIPLPDAEIDLNYQSYIVKYKSPPELRPSGNSQRVYQVDRIQLKSISDSLYSLQLQGSRADKAKTLALIAGQPNVEYVEPDFPVEVIPQTTSSDVPDDPYFSKQWFHQTLKSLSAWSINDGSPELLVAVVDTGVDYTHPDLAANMWTNPDEVANGKDDDGNGLVDDIHGWNFAANSNDPRTTKKSPHGSHVAGLIGASGSNHLGVIGVAPKVRMIALKFMDDSGSGITSNAVKAIDYAIKKKVFLINSSWGSNRFSRTLSDAITRAANAGILFMAAAGNGNKGVGYDIKSTPWYPASYTQWNVFSVAATTSNDQLAAFSNYSKTKVDVAAPGYSIFSTVSGTNYQMMSGTSMATPIVSGLAVLVKATNPSLKGEQILSIVRESTDKIAQLKDKIASGGRVNAYKAVLLARASRSCLNK